MAIKHAELLKWVFALPTDCHVAVDDGGLTLVVIEEGSGAYLEVGGIPDYHEQDDPIEGETLCT